MIRSLVLATLSMFAAGLVLHPLETRAQTTSGATDSTILVFDVSNSMWGQIDGVAKIEIAREVIGDLLKDWNPATDLGLVAYGHRRTGDCSDIEQVIPVGPVNPSEFSRLVNSLVPRGKTPLTDAVRQAAEILNYSDTRATVILVSDGIESCNADPCALARELERGGIGFTAHVVGFDVSKIEDQRQLSCLAEETGGQYLTANNATELLNALQSVAAPPPPPPPPMLRIRAVTTENGSAISDPSVRWTLVDMSNENTLIDGQTGASLSLEAAAGRYLARAEFDGGSGTAEFSFAAESDELISVVIEYAPLATLEAPDSVEAGSGFEVVWTGPAINGDFVAIVEPDSREGTSGNYAYTRNGNPAELRAPDVPGPYELRYVAKTDRKTLASLAITVVPTPASLSAVSPASAGADLEVSWEGPDNRNDFVAVTPAGAKEGEYGNYAYTRRGNPLEVKMPDEPGEYELRYITGQSRLTLASLPITVNAVTAMLEATDQTGAGTSVTVTWTGPDNRNDFIAVTPAGAKEGEYGNYTYTRRGNPLEVKMPDEPGEYELRYMTGQTRTTLASLPITVTSVSASLLAVAETGAGATISVNWEGPDNHNDFITVVPVGTKEGEYDNYTYTRRGNPLDLLIPDEAGDYELRYLANQSRATLGSAPITVLPVSAALQSVGQAGAGATISINWEGPGNHNDLITIVPVGTKEGEYDNYTYTRQGNPLDLRVPDEPGDYELRYVTRQTRRTLGSSAITVTPVTATLETASAVSAGGLLTVIWEGPDNHNDFITIVPVGTKEGDYDNYTYTRRGNPLGLKAPDVPGDYEVRYLMHQSRRTLASVPVRVN